MRIFGRKSLRYADEIDLAGIDTIVFQLDERRWVEVSLYRARIDGRIEIRASRAVIIRPNCANVIVVEDER